MIVRKKLIEVALPLAAINEACAREKSIRQGNPVMLHLWWARRPLAAARAVIFAQMVDDPSGHPDLFPTVKQQEEERQRLFRIIEDLVLWENTTNLEVLQVARKEIWSSWRRTCAENAIHPRARELFDPTKLPLFHDPFAGGGALPLEAQRLGLKSYASDLNPVAVLINKAMIEIPITFADRPPVNLETRKDKQLFTRQWSGVRGLADDVRHYGHWMRNEVETRIGHLYPKIEVTAEMARDRPDLEAYVGQKLTVIAWIWARTVKSPNPAFSHVDVPLASTFMLSTKPGKEACVEPVIESGNYRFTVKAGKPSDADVAKNGTKLSRGANFRCLMSATPIAGEYIKAEGKSGRMGAKLMAIVAEGDRERVYLAPAPDHEAAALAANPAWKPDNLLPPDMRSHWTPPYGLTTYGDLFTPRQLQVLSVLSDLLGEVRECVIRDAVSAGFPDQATPLNRGGSGSAAYADAVATYLSMMISNLTDLNNSLCRWKLDRGCPVNLFSRQAIPMAWDFPETNPLSESAGSLESQLSNMVRRLESGLYAMPGCSGGRAAQRNAMSSEGLDEPAIGSEVISTDPPYYDNIGYADLSDFFYVWLRKSLRSVFPDLFATLGVPKDEELVATPYRHGGKGNAEKFFLDGMTKAMQRLTEQSHPAFPVTIYYAFKQSESDSDDGTTNTGWDTFLAAVIEAGFSMSGTLPLRTELSNRMIGSGTNALASSIVLVCRPRSADAPTVTRREFINALKAELPPALAHLQHGNIAPVDLAQAAIGPGMAVYTRFAKVLDAEGKPLTVRDALTLINQTLDETLAEQEGDFDADTRWALAWFEQSGFAEGDYGVAETLSKAKNTSVSGLVEAGILTSGRGKVRLLKPAELPATWDPATDPRLTAWEVVHHLIRVLEAGGEVAASALVMKLGPHAETARELCYRLYAVCERKKRASEALSYNALVQSWPEILRLAQGGAKPVAAQTEMSYDVDA